MKLKDFRKTHNITQAKIAEICEVSQNTVSSWENGIAVMNLKYALLIAKYFDVELSEVYDVSDMFTIPQNKVKETPSGAIDIMGSIESQLMASFKNLSEEQQKLAIAETEKLQRRTQRITEIAALVNDLDDEQYNAVITILKTMKKES